MMTWMLGTLINHLFEEKVGRWQAKKPLSERKGFAVTLNLNTRFTEDGNTPLEEGYRYADIVLYGYANYITVFTRTRSTLAPVDKDGNIIGDYEKSATKWEEKMHHDSCWREAVNDWLFEHSDNACTLGHTDFKSDRLGDPYAVVPLQELLDSGVEIKSEIKEASYAKNILICIRMKGLCRERYKQEPPITQDVDCAAKRRS